MLNFEQRRVLKALNLMRKTGDAFHDTELYNLTRIYDREKMVMLCRELESLGYINFLAVDLSNGIQTVTLSYRGLIYAREFRNQLLKFAFDWITENLVGLAALIVSIIALLRSL